MTEVRYIPIVLLGMGNVGRTLLRQILETRDTLARRTGLRLAPIALADVSGMLADPAGLSETQLRAALAEVSRGRLLEAVPGVRSLSELQAVLRPGAILADVTASPDTGPLLRAALRGGCGVVLANKIPLGGAWSHARDFFAHPKLRCEVTVGAGLPVIGTLRYLLDTGDRVTDIEGCLSGTLGYLCAQLELGIPYSEAVAQARALGYTEPDPREDLGGKDVARKALILARTAGWPLESSDLTVEALYPQELAALSVGEFLAGLSAQNSGYLERMQAAQREGQTLRYVARVTSSGGSVGLVAVPQSSSLGALRGPGNYIAFHTVRYAEIPLVVAGPGAGPEVTAAGILGDLIVLALSDSQGTGCCGTGV